MKVIKIYEEYFVETNLFVIWKRDKYVITLNNVNINNIFEQNPTEIHLSLIGRGENSKSQRSRV